MSQPPSDQPECTCHLHGGYDSRCYFHGVDGTLRNSPAAAAEADADAEALKEFEEGVGYRTRGRPKLPPDMKRRENMSMRLTAGEKRELLHAAADADGGPHKVQDWARDTLLAEARRIAAAKKAKEEGEKK